MSAARALLLGLALAATAGARAGAREDPVLAPPAAEALPPALQAARDDLARIVAARDLAALRRHVREDTTLSFGGDHGTQGFDDLWTRDPADTRRLWEELDAILALPGVARDEDGRQDYCAPYVSCLPYDAGIDVFDAQVVLEADAAIRDRPDPAGRVLARVSHAVLTGAGDALAPGAAWVRMRTAAGVEGYIARHQVRSPIDYRLSIIGDGAGGWGLRYFVAGD